VCIAVTLDQLLKQENIVLEFWTTRKRRIDQCQQYVVLETSAKQVNNGWLIIYAIYTAIHAFSALMLLLGQQEGHSACKRTKWWGSGMVICLEWGADLHTAQQMPLPLASVKSRLVLPFWYWLTQVVLEKGPLNVCNNLLVVFERSCSGVVTILDWATWVQIFLRLDLTHIVVDSVRKSIQKS